MLRLTIVAWGLVALLATALVAARPATAHPTGATESVLTRQAPKITIGTSSYYTVPATRALGLIRSPYARLVSSAIRLCRGASAHGFISLNGRAVGAVAWVPTNLQGCLEVSGGGPGNWQPCAQFYRTADGKYVVLYVGTNQVICADLSTQVPGGVAARTNTAVSSPIGQLAAGTELLIKCQRRSSTGNGWQDYVAQYRPALPASKWAFFIHDLYVDTGGQTRLRGVPTCGGTSVQF